MLEIILKLLKGIPEEYAVVITAALPVSELRGAIPLGLSLGLGLAKSFWLSVLGNTLFVVPALFLFQPLTSRLRKFRPWSRFFDWLFERTRRNADTVQRYEALGLMIFVAIPLPMTGAWSGVVAASLFRIRFRYALLAIFSGIICAGIIVSSLCALGIFTWKAVAH